MYYLFTQLTLCFINQLAGVVAVEVTGGPTIDFVPGRKVIVLYKWQPQRTFDVFGRTSQIQLFCITEQFSILLALVICHKVLRI